MPPQTPKKILIIQLRRIGDVLMCTPFVRELREAFPQAYLVFLTEKESEVIFQHNPYINETLILEKDRYKNPLYVLEQIRKIRKKRFDWVIDLFGNPRSAWLAFFSGAKKKIGYNYRFRQHLYNQVIRYDNTVKYAALKRLDVLNQLGIEADDPQLDFFLSDRSRKFAKDFFAENDIDSNKLIISLSATSRRHFRRWSLGRYAQLADWLIDNYKAEVILVWGPNEKDVVEKLDSLTRNRLTLSKPTPSLLELGAILDLCDIHIGNDNGTKHIAVALGKPTLTIYGPDDPVSWTFPDYARHKWVKKDVDCEDCGKKKHKCQELTCLDLLTVEDVQNEFVKLVESLIKIGEKRIVEKIEHLRAHKY